MYPEHQRYVLLLGLLLWYLIPPIAAGCCTDGQTQEDPNDRSSYFICRSGTFVHTTCTNGTYWNPDIEVCAECEQNEVEADPQNCAAYFLCLMGQFVAQKCARGTYFEGGIKACVVDTIGYCPLPQMSSTEVLI